MKRSVGVTVIAILSLIGSALVFAMGVLMLAVMGLAPTPRSNEFPGSPAFFKIILVFAALMYLLPAVWGVLTGIGLWRLKNWARISIIVFAVLLSVMGGFAGLISFAVPFPVAPDSGVNPSVMSSMRIVMGAFWLSQLAVGIWWLVFFNRPRVKAQFLQPSLEAAGALTLQAAYPLQIATPNAATHRTAERPLSITILAWLLLAGTLFIPFSLALHAPAILFTKLLTGRAAGAFFLSFAILQLCIGVGLLRLKPAARIAAIAYFIFGVVNTAIFYLAPGGHGRALALVESQQSMFPWMRFAQNQSQFLIDSTPLIAVGAAGGVIATAIPIYFLITRKFAFERAAAERGSNSKEIL